MERERSMCTKAAVQKMFDVTTAFAVMLPVPIRRCNSAEGELEVDGRAHLGCEVRDGVWVKTAV